VEIITDFTPKPGDIVRRMLPSGYVQKYTFVICPECSEGRWVQAHTTKLPTFTGLCQKCSLLAAKARGWSRF